MSSRGDDNSVTISEPVGATVGLDGADTSGTGVDETTIFVKNLNFE